MAQFTLPTTNEDEQKRLLLFWDEKPDAGALTLLRGPRADGVQRDQIRVVPGVQPYKHNHYTKDEFYRLDRGSGALSNVYGQRLIRVSEDFVVACLGALEDEVGDAAGEIMYRCGYEWGLEDMKSFSRRVQAEFEADLKKMGTGFLLETWWWPLTIEGWGTWRYDFTQYKQGLVFIELFESAVAQSIGNIGKVVCYFYAGLFAAVFGSLCKQELGSIEIQCYSMGEDRCKFLIATKKRVNAAAFWRAEGATSKDIVKKVKELS